jgi:hypothetical protein
MPLHKGMKGREGFQAGWPGAQKLVQTLCGPLMPLLGEANPQYEHTQL